MSLEEKERAVKHAWDRWVRWGKEKCGMSLARIFQTYYFTFDDN